MIAEFLDYLEYEKRYSNHTLLAYKKDLSQFSNYLKAIFGDLQISKVQHIHIRSWMVELVNNKISSRSINRKLSTLRSYFNYLKRKELILKNPTLKIIPPKAAKKLPEFIQEKSFDQLIQAEYESLNYSDLRDLLIVQLLYNTGMRRSELNNLKLIDIDMRLNQLKVLGKGNKQRLIPISKAMNLKLQHYLNVKTEFFEEKPTEAFFFLTNKGKRLYPKMIYNIVKRQIQKLSTVKKRSPHVLRHSFATHLMNNGADLNAVKELLGHASLSATQIYTHNSIEKLKDAYKNAHPKAKD